MACLTFCYVFLLVNVIPSVQAGRDAGFGVGNVTIREDASVGSTVKHLRDFLNVGGGLMEEENGTSWSVNITSGNDLGRFEVVVENLTLIVAAPLDYEYNPRYNLSLELKNTGDNSVWHVNLAIVITDVWGYPPYYSKQCETPVIPDTGTAENYVVLSSHNGHYNVKINNGKEAQYNDFFPYFRHKSRYAIINDCYFRWCFALTIMWNDLDALRPALEAPQNGGRIEFKCHDKELRSVGKFMFLDVSKQMLPEWAQDSRCSMTEGVNYVVVVEMNDLRSTSSYWTQCSANVTFHDNTYPVDFIFQYDITGCSEGRYGLYCDKYCVCKNGARCHGFNGACECRPGWRGRACDIPWPEVVIIASPGDSVVKYIGTNLTLTCLAPHIQVASMTWIHEAENYYNDTKIIKEALGAVQNSSINFQPVSESDNAGYTCVVKAVNGEVINAIFTLNATKCRPNYHGEGCSQVCDCEYGGTCDRWEGCLCPPGRRGDRCQHECAPGTFGRDCRLRCYCENNALCDPVNGSCICAEGQSGEFCQNSSSPEKNQVVVVVLSSVIPTIVLIACIITGVLVKRSRRRQRAEQPTADLEMTPFIENLSSWEIDKEDIHLEHMIGEGEFGHVVRARLRVPEGYQVLVAAKSIRPDRMTASAVRDFRREMDILARIHEDKEGHPNVVKFYGVLTKSDPQYILVEYAANEELRRYLWGLREQYRVTGQRKLLERLGFACDVACGLAELARLKIVHRDIAARNVVISDRMVAKIADFGLSRDVYASSAYKRTNQGGEEELLPLKWMAVESLRDGVYTCESDVWSYGVLLWEIASFGEEPRYAGSPMHPDVCTLLELLKKGVRLRQPENCPLPVYRIIRSCWIVDPSKRPTPEVLLQKIEQLRPPRHAAHLVNHGMTWQ
ncbi:PREDICTED: putative wall-associated receptor kinase-like 11 [Branchiostoma belcheri]|uniref:receptor protein-tyrosine kinase n=1 Tax=Branchiostoma belcheri TaxID=7741 RepID=A0A6P4Y813_BRABE|nr:PREDICTED: putative wall-associated receptor kinase-like 11 [Branchiostoma belcheri]